MYRTLLFAAVVMPLCFFGGTHANEPGVATSIPLDKIWGFKIPDSIDLEKVADAAVLKEIQSIQRALSKPPAGPKNARTAFVVEGNGLNAVSEARGVLVDGKKSRGAIRQGEA